MMLLLLCFVVNYLFCYLPFEGKYGLGKGKGVYAPNIILCLQGKYSWMDDFIARMVGFNDETTGFMQCTKKSFSMLECDYFLGNGLFGTSEFSPRSYSYDSLKGSKSLNPLSPQEDISDVEFALSKATFEYFYTSSKVDRTDCIAQISPTPTSWSSTYTVSSQKYGNGTLHLCTDFSSTPGSFVGYLVFKDTKKDPIQLYGKLTESSIGGGHWYTPKTTSSEKNSASYEFGSILIYRGVNGDPKNGQLMIFNDFVFGGVNGWQTFDIYGISDSESVSCNSQSVNGMYSGSRGGSYNFMILNQNNFFGYYSSDGTYEGKGILVGKYDEDQKEATGNCYFVNSYSSWNDSFSIDLSTTVGTAFAKIHCLSDYSVFLDRKSIYTNVFQSFGMFVSKSDGERNVKKKDSDDGIVGEFSENSVQDISICRKEDSDHVIVSYDGNSGYQEGLAHENNNVVVSAYADEYNGALRSGIILMSRISDGYVVHGLRGVGISYAHEEIEEYDYIGVFPPNNNNDDNDMRKKKNSNEFEDDNGWIGDYSKCKKNTRSVPYSPFGDWKPPSPPKPKPKKQPYIWYDEWWFIMICTIAGIIIFAVAVYFLNRLCIKYTKWRKKKLLNVQRSEYETIDEEDYLEITDNDVSINNVENSSSSSDDGTAEIVSPISSENISDERVEFVVTDPPVANYSTFVSEPDPPRPKTPEEVNLPEEPTVEEYKPLMPVSGYQNPSPPEEQQDSYEQMQMSSNYQSSAFNNNNNNDTSTFGADNMDPMQSTGSISRLKNPKKSLVLTKEPESDEIHVSKFDSNTYIRLYFESTSSNWESVLEFQFSTSTDKFEISSKVGLGKVSPSIFDSDVEDALKRVNWSLSDLQSVLLTMNQEWGWKSVKWVLQKK